MISTPRRFALCAVAFAAFASTAAAQTLRGPLPPAPPADPFALPDDLEPGPADSFADPDGVPPEGGPATPAVRPQAPLARALPVARPQAVRPRGTGDPPPGTRPLTPAPARQPTPRITAEDPYAEGEDPYAPIGIRTGTFLWLPAIEGRVVATTNVQESAGGKPGLRLEVAPELVGRSDWSRHQLEVDLRGSFTKVPSDPDLDKPRFTGTIRGRIDVLEATKIELETAYQIDQESVSSAETPAGAKTGSTVETLRGTAGVIQDVGRLKVTLRGEADRTTYTEGTLGTGAIAPPDDRDNVTLTGTLRAAYEVSPGLRPFIEGRLVRILYDAPLIGGLDRDADGWVLKAGVALDFGPQLKGEVAVGHVMLRPEDPTLSALRGTTFDANLVWAPTRLTTLTLRATTTFEPTTLAGSPGSLQHTVEATLAHALRRNLRAELTGTYSRRDYAGIDREEATETVAASLVWKLDPTAALTARVGYERFTPSGDGGRGYEATFVGLGLRLQR